MTDAQTVLGMIDRAKAGGNGRVVVLPPPAAPVDVARQLVDDHYASPEGAPLLRYWRAGWWRWHGSHWTEAEGSAIRAEAYSFTERATYQEEGKKAAPWAPNRRKVADLLEALATVCYLREDINPPAWLEDLVRMVRGPSHCEACYGRIVACDNGLLALGTRALLPHGPDYFNQTAVPFGYDPEAPRPSRWLEFVHQLWPNDHESINALQEWFGYTISGRTDLHKILLIVGPTRGGKGAITRLLGAIVGRENVAGPTLSSLRGDFGLAPLIGKPLAVISDARLSGSDSSVVVERLLSISGEDWLTVNRKHREQWNGKLPTRFVACSNELPRLGDASGAIAGRFVTLLLDRSWLGKEDPELEPALHRELPGVLNWALEGLARLEECGRFTVPGSTKQAFIALQDLASPVRAFIRDCCEMGPDREITVDELWKAWRTWCDDNGHGRGGTRQMFGRDLRAALPALRVRRPREGEEKRSRTYAGISLASAMRGTADHADQNGHGSLW